MKVLVKITLMADLEFVLNYESLVVYRHCLTNFFHIV